MHHPSSEGAFHDYLNVVSSSIAAMHEVPVIHLKPLTVAQTRRISQREGAPRGITGHHMYHGYDYGALWDHVAAQLERICGMR